MGYQRVPYSYTSPQTLPHQAMAHVADLIQKACANASPFGNLGARLEAYFNGEHIDFPVEVDIQDATDFQQTVWKVTSSIPYGETRSYGWVAQEIGKPRAARGVGQALAQNPLPIVIPCHRVVGRGGLG